MSYDKVITHLYYLLIASDGHINDKEIAAAKKMVQCESMDDSVFQSEMLLLPSLDKKKVYSEAVVVLKKLPHKKQVRIIAWLCVLANADGFMDKLEWQFIYGLYQKELHLDLQEIFDAQREINFMILEKRALSIL